MIECAVMVPHPPIAVPEIGRGEEKKIQKTLDSFEEAAKFVASFKPDTVVITSPHATAYADYFQISPGERAQGNFGQFRAPQVQFDIAYDTEFRKALVDELEKAGFPGGTDYERMPQLDHGTMVPLYFLEKELPDAQFVRIGLSGLPLSRNYELGELIARAAEKTGKRVALIASGDLSHCQKEDGPYGYKPEGPEYDRRIMEDMGQADFGKLFDYSPDFRETAAECGHGSFAILAGAFDGQDVKAKPLSHEDTFGVGYGFVEFTPEGPDENRHFLKEYEHKAKKEIEDRIAKEDAYVALARSTINSYIKKEPIYVPENLPEEMEKEQAGVFVSIHENGQLRGCIGTIEPTKPNITEEILNNAVSASTRDPRFPAITVDELPYLDINVDVLAKPEPISSPDELDVKKYGVIVTKGRKRGLLLPNLEGVDTIEQQIAIACSKAGLRPDEPGIQLERFEVVRHV